MKKIEQARNGNADERVRLNLELSTGVAIPLSFATKMNHIFVALIEVRPLVGCELDPNEFDGAAVRCYVPAASEEQARALLSDTLRRDRFELVEEEFFVRVEVYRFVQFRGRRGFVLV